MTQRPGRSIARVLETRVVGFCRQLREAGLMVTTSEVIDVMSALEATGVGEERVFHDSLATCLVKRPDEIAVFEAEYARFWRERAKSRGVGREKGRSSIPTPRAGSIVIPPQPDRGLAPRLAPGADEGRDESAPVVIARFSPVERKQTKIFDLDMKEVAHMRRALRRMRRRLATVRGRTPAASRRGRPDLGRTLRSAVGRGELLKIEREERTLSKMRLLVLCDISGSMDAHSDRLVKLLHVAANSGPSSRVFVFSTGLRDLSKHLRGRSLVSAAGEITQNVEIWSSGTRIGSALQRLLREHAAFLSPRTVLLVVSDGWELGDLELLGDCMREIRRRVSKVVWVNPLADHPDFEPETAGMKVVLPFVDHLGGLELLVHPREFERVFGKLIGPES